MPEIGRIPAPAGRSEGAVSKPASIDRIERVVASSVYPGLAARAEAVPTGPQRKPATSHLPWPRCSKPTTKTRNPICPASCRLRLIPYLNSRSMNHHRSQALSALAASSIIHHGRSVMDGWLEARRSRPCSHDATMNGGRLGGVDRLGRVTNGPR